GRLGTPDQLKVGVFGPVVNQAARLESMTRRLAPSSVLLDEATAVQLKNYEKDGELHCRRLARVRPQGMDTVLTIYELVPQDLTPPLEADEEEMYAGAGGAFEAGRWDVARKLLAELPAEDGGVRLLWGYLAAQGDSPPDGWDGVITLDAK